MHIHILGICGTFMGSMALLAKELGHDVTGSDVNVYPPMSTQLREQGITLMQGYKAEHLDPVPDLIVIGNALSRGNEAVEFVLEKGLKYVSGAQWLRENVLQERWVLAVAGTHGKTTTASMLAWILEYAGMSPGFLIGGVPSNFPVSSRLGETPFFVIEADEYDTAFFDKRSKFVHYKPQTLILNNLEYDHADIFPDLAAIQRQFHHLLRTVPRSGQVIVQGESEPLKEVVEMGCWSELVTAGSRDDNQWSIRLSKSDGSEFTLLLKGEEKGRINWELSGVHNAYNGMMAAIAARHVGVDIKYAIEALSLFQGVKRRMELLEQTDSYVVYDDFAHHPTAIETTLEGLRNKVGQDKVIAIIEPRSNTMRLGCHREMLAPSVVKADYTFWYQPDGLDWDLDNVIPSTCVEMSVESTIAQIIDKASVMVRAFSRAGQTCHIVIMSNGGFAGIHHKLIHQLRGSISE